MQAKKRRRALVGFSSPLAYDYVHPASRAPADQASSPNPILDSPFGLMLLFDEIVFVTRSLCPENMRGLPYVRFLDEEGFAPAALALPWDAVRDRIEQDPRWKAVTGNPSSMRPGFGEILEAAGVSWNGVDNHTHGLNVAGLQAGGNADLDNLVRDFLILDQLGASEFELVTNSFTQPFLEPQVTPLPTSRLTELLLIRNIHNYLDESGPYHPVVDEARENQYLSDFRRWISDSHGHVSAGEVRDVQLAVEDALQTLQDKVFMQHLDGKSHYVGIGKAVIGDAIGLLVPGAGIAMAVGEEAVKHAKHRDQRWAGFVVSARSSFRALKK